ncbi:tetratricopeptide repeat protein [Actinoplanes derwentensis]|uniref:tetratricopeptide repeat protein n=1 Tax=Actinoplanes derwentensis TaxID=113562 RepID=UPI001E34147E|nr:tetratricopeptide repeat protein [Actinoplanes derwentensis]
MRRDLASVRRSPHGGPGLRSGPAASDRSRSPLLGQAGPDRPGHRRPPRPDPAAAVLVRPGRGHRHRATLTLAPHAHALYQRGWAYRATGRPGLALDDYEQALTLYRQAGDRGDEAATLTNIGGLYVGLGDYRQALTYYEQALPVRREVGDRVGEAATRYNMAMRYRDSGDLAATVAQLEQVVELDRQVEHPDLADDTAMLEQVRRELAQAPTET